MRFTALKKAAAGAAVALIAAGTMAMSAAPASAAEGPQARGFNGQQIKFCINGNGASAQAEGTSHTGKFVRSPEIALNNGCTDLGGWWWKNQVKITWRAPQGDRVSYCTVPVNQNGNFHRCDYPKK